MDTAASPSPRLRRLKRTRDRRAPAATASLDVSNNIIPLYYGFSNGQISYSLPVTLGADGPDAVSLRAQLDTGSSDAWFAAKGCKGNGCVSSSSGSNDVVKYDAAGAQGATDLDAKWNITYIAGSASGSVYAQTMTLGTATLANQAFGSASYVQDQDLEGMNVTGLLGLALPANSVIQEVLSPGVNNAAWTNNNGTGDVLTSLWGHAEAQQRTFAVGLQRLPSDGGGQAANSTLALGGIDSAYLPQSQYERVTYANVLPDSDGVARHWKLYLTHIQVTSGNLSAAIPTSFAGQKQQYPTVVLDTGASLNYAPSDILNALYGAYKDSSGNTIGPGEDGICECETGWMFACAPLELTLNRYLDPFCPPPGTADYVPCSLPLNISLTVGGATIPLHPLDASVHASYTLDSSASGSSVSGCIGSFQSITSGSPAGADIVLGTPFLRSVYTLYSCDTALANTTDSASATTSATTSAATSTSTASDDDGTGPCTSPVVGLYPTVTDLPAAYEQFNEVRVQGKALGSNSAYGINVNTSGSSGGLSTGAKAAIGIVCALVGIIVLFGALVWFARRRALRQREKRRRMAGAGGAGGAYPLEKVRGRASADDEGDDSEEEGGEAANEGDAGVDADGTPVAATRTRTRSTRRRGGPGAGGGQGAPKTLAELSAKEQAQLREAAILHGYFDEEVFGLGGAETPRGAGAAGDAGGLGAGAGAGAAPGGGTTPPYGYGSGSSWETDSKGYGEARRIRREYLERHPSLTQLRGSGSAIAEESGSGPSEGPRRANTRTKTNLPAPAPPVDVMMREGGGGGGEEGDAAVERERDAR